MIVIMYGILHFNAYNFNAAVFCYILFALNK